MTLHPGQVFEVRQTEVGSLRLLFGSGCGPASCPLCHVQSRRGLTPMSAQTRSSRRVLCGFLVRFQLGERSSPLSDEIDEYKVFQTFALRFLGKNHSRRVIYMIRQKRKLRGVLPTGPRGSLQNIYSFLLTENSGTSLVFSGLFFLSDLVINIPWTRFVPRNHYGVLLVNMLRPTLVQCQCTCPFFTGSDALLTFSSRPCSLGKVSPFAHSLFASW